MTSVTSARKIFCNEHLICQDFAHAGGPLVVGFVGCLPLGFVFLNVSAFAGPLDVSELAGHFLKLDVISETDAVIFGAQNRYLVGLFLPFWVPWVRFGSLEALWGPMGAAERTLRAPETDFY